MADMEKIPFLLSLLDDDSLKVREAVLLELKSFGPELVEFFQELSFVPNYRQSKVLHPILAPLNRLWLQKEWEEWLEMPEEEANFYTKLEKGLSLLANFQYNRLYPIALSQLLDDLAQEYLSQCDHPEVLKLARFLFQEKSLGGAKEDYYNPLHSNLLYTIEKGQGLPISLACIYILVGNRVDLLVEGCNLPGHFFARIYQGNKMFLVDCFEGGQVIDPADIRVMSSNISASLIQEITKQKVSADVIMRRILSNLMVAYQNQKNWVNRQLVFDLFSHLEKQMRESALM